VGEEMQSPPSKPATILTLSSGIFLDGFVKIQNNFLCHLPGIK